MSHRNVIQQAFDAFGKSAALEKRSGNWYGLTREIISVSNLQKSQYGLRYYFNQGLWIRCLDEKAQYPKPSECHIQARLGALFPEHEKYIDSLLDLECRMDDGSRSLNFSILLTQKLLPILRACDSVDSLRAMYANGLFKRAGIRGPAQQLLKPA